MNLMIKKIRDKTRDAHFVWFGSRSLDASPILDISSKLGVVCLVGEGKDINNSVSGFSLELFSGKRIDYDRFGWDGLDIKYTSQIIHYLEIILKKSNVVIVPFSASQFVSNIGFSFPSIKIAGNFFHLEQAFNYKPWVEFQFKKYNIPVNSWSYYMIGSDIQTKLDEKEWLVRPASGTGGMGMLRINSLQDLLKIIKKTPTPQVASFTKYLPEIFSLNVSACLFPSGALTIHPISTQIIGSPICTDREFGYCGNDYESVKEILSEKDIEKIEIIIRKVGRWLHSYGYIGSFGLDLIKDKSNISVTELNARYQASAFLASKIMDRIGFNNIYTDHIAAHFSIEPSGVIPSLKDITKLQPPFSQVICYYLPEPNSDFVKNNTKEKKAHLLGEFQLLPKVKKLQKHSLLFRYITGEKVLTDGRNISEDIQMAISKQKSKTVETIAKIEGLN